MITHPRDLFVVGCTVRVLSGPYMGEFGTVVTQTLTGLDILVRLKGSNQEILLPHEDLQFWFHGLEYRSETYDV